MARNLVHAEACVCYRHPTVAESEVQERYDSTTTEESELARILSGRELRIKRPESRADPCRELDLGKRPVSHAKDDVHDLRFRGVDFVAIEQQEHVGGDESDPLVPVEEGVVPDQAEPVGGRKVGEVRIGLIPPAISRPSKCGVQQTLIPETGLSTVGPDLIEVDSFDGSTGDPGRFRSR